MLPYQPFEIENVDIVKDFDGDNYYYKIIESGSLVATKNNLLDSITINTTSITPTTSSGIKNIPIISSKNGIGGVVTLYASGSLVTSTDALLTSIILQSENITAGIYTGLTTITNGSGYGCIISVTATTTSGITTITSVTVTTSGSDYHVGDSLIVSTLNLPGSTTDLTFILKEDDITGTIITGITVTSMGENYKISEEIVISNLEIPGSSTDLKIILKDNNLWSYNVDDNKKNGLIYDSNNNIYLINNNEIVSKNTQFESGNYRIMFFDNKKSVFFDSKCNIYNYERKIFEEVNFFRSINVYFDGINTLDTHISNIPFNKTGTYYLYNNTTKKYMYPVYLTDSQSTGTFYEDIIKNLKIYYDVDTLLNSDLEPTSLGYLNLNGSFYYLSNSKYYYPLFIDSNQLNLQSINNDYKSIELDGHIETYQSAAKTFPVIEPWVNYNENLITTAFANTEWNFYFQISNNISGAAYSIDVLPTSLTKYDNNDKIHYRIYFTPTSTGTQDIEIKVTDSIKSRIVKMKFKLNIVSNANQLHFISNVKPNAFTDTEYKMHVIAKASNGNTITNYKLIDAPDWLSLITVGGQYFLSGKPTFINFGENKVKVEVTDSGSSSQNMEFTIFVHHNTKPYILSEPYTDIIVNTAHSEIIRFNDNESDSITISFVENPTWLSYTIVSGKHYIVGTPTSTGEEKVIIKIMDSQGRFSYQTFTYRIHNANEIRFTSTPKTIAFNTEYYSYQVSAVDSGNNKANIVDTLIPYWLTLGSDNILYGTPSNFNLGENDIILTTEDASGNYCRQKFTINVINNRNNRLVLKDGIFQETFKNINLDYGSKILINGKFFTFKNIIDLYNHSELIFEEELDLSGNVKIKIPLHETNNYEYSINNHLVTSNSNLINYKYRDTYKEIKIYCYYTKADSPNQEQLKIFTVSYNKYTIFKTNKLFNYFYIDNNSRMKVFIENYVPITIISYTVTASDYLFTFSIDSLQINNNKKCLVEEIESDGNRIIHYVNVIFENGLLKIDRNIMGKNKDNLSKFYINRLIPIRIVDNYIQQMIPYLNIHQHLPNNCSDQFETWMKIPIKVNSIVVEYLGDWIIEISSKYLHILEKYPIYTDLPRNNSRNIRFLSMNNKYYLRFLKGMPNVNMTFVYIKQINHFKYLSKNNNTWKTSDINTPDDKTLEIYLNNKWNTNIDRTKIPITISDKDLTNKNLGTYHYIIVNDYDVPNLEYIDSQLEYFIDNQNVKIVRSGYSTTNELEIVLNRKIGVGSVNLIYRSENTNIIYPNIHEPSQSVNNFSNYIRLLEMDTQLCFNKAKSWKDWTSITFSNNPLYSPNNQIFNKILKTDSNQSITLIDNEDNNILLFEEVKTSSSLQNISKILSNSSNNYNNYDRLIRIREVEKIIFDYIKTASKESYFWENPIENINNYLKVYKLRSDNLPPYKDFKIVKNCIIETKHPTLSSLDEVEISITTNSSFRVVDSDNIERIGYLDNQFELSISRYTSPGYIIINRSKQAVINEVNLFINKKKESYYGINSHILLRYISYIHKNKDEFFTNILEGDKFGTNCQKTDNKINKYDFNYNIVTPEKLLISKQWDNLITKEEFNNFNTEFNDILKIDYTQDMDYDLSGNFNGYYQNNIGKVNKIGLLSDNNIEKIDFTEDSHIYYNTYSFNQLLDGNRRDIDYVLKTDEFFKYIIRSSDDVSFKPEYSYSIDSLEGDHIIKDDSLKIKKYYENGLEIFSNQEYKDYDNISLNIEKEYTISKSELTGFFYKDIVISDLSSVKVNLYLDNSKIIKISSKITHPNTTFSVISQLELKDTDIFRIELNVAIIRYEDDGTNVYLYFTNNLSESNLFESIGTLYININSKSYKLNKLNNNFYLSRTFFVDKEIDTTVNYVVFGYKLLSSIQSKKTNLLAYNIKLTTDLEYFDYILNSPLQLNFKVDNIVIDDIRLISANELYVYKKASTGLRNSKTLSTEFKIEKQKPLLISKFNLDDPGFLVEIENDTKIITNSTIKMKRNNYPTISGIKNRDTSGNNFLFQTTKKYTKYDLIGYNTEITNTVPITTFTLNDGILFFTLTSDLQFKFNNNISYYVDISGSYGVIDSSKISINKTDIKITLPKWESYTATSSFNFQQVDISNKEIKIYENDQTASVTLSSNNLLLNNDKIDFRYLDKNNNEIGNYIYYFEPGTDVFNIHGTYKLRLGNKITNLFLIGMFDNKMYVGSEYKIDNNSSNYYKIYDTSYQTMKEIRGDSIFYQSKSYYNGTIINSTVLNEYKINFDTMDVSNILIVFPNDETINANLYMSRFITSKTNLDIKNISNVGLKFPEELEYKNYYIDVIKTEQKEEEVIWDNEFAYKVFDYIYFYINNQKIDTHDYYIYKSSQYYTEKIMELVPKKVGNKFVLYLPTFFWFKQDSANFLPLISLQNSRPYLNLKLNSLENLIKNDISMLDRRSLDTQLNKKLKLDMITDTILLDSIERKKFAEYNHEYLIQRNISYPKVLINTITKEIPLPIKGLIKDIFWFCNSEKTNKPYITNLEKDRDEYYSEFLETYNLYQRFIDNNRTFGLQFSTDYKYRFEILDKIVLMILNDTGNGLVNTIKNHHTLKKYNIIFVLYLFYYRLTYYDKIEFSSELSRNRRKFSKLVLYFTKVYKDSESNNKLHPIKDLEFKANGRSLLAETNYQYYNSVVAVDKFTRSSDYGDYMYSFSLYPCLSQPSGQLNFNILKDPTLLLKMNPNVLTENVRMNTVVKEYQILRIIGGQASLSWI